MSQVVAVPGLLEAMATKSNLKPTSQTTIKAIKRQINTATVATACLRITTMQKTTQALAIENHKATTSTAHLVMKSRIR